MNKHLTLSGLQTVLPPIKHLIDKKAENVNWNENDPNAKGYVKNRPFYVEYGNGKVLLDGTFVPDERAVLIDYFEIIEGEKYIVTFNGIEYSTIGKYFQEDGFSCYYLGNGGLGFGLDDTGEPFFIGLIPGNSVIISDTQEFTITVKSYANKYHKIDPKFLPEVETAMIVKGPDVTMYVEEAPKANKTAIEIYEAYTSGKQVYFQYSDGAPFMPLVASTIERAIFIGNFVEGVNTLDQDVNKVRQIAYEINSEGFIFISSSIQTLSDQLDNMVPDYRTINGQLLQSDIVLTATDVGAATEEFVTNQISTVPNNGNILNGTREGSLRTINSKLESDTYSLGMNSFSEGYDTSTPGACAHAEGRGTTAFGLAAHAEGQETVASGNYSHAEGVCTITNYQSSFVNGEYNIYEEALYEIEITLQQETVSSSITNNCYKISGEISFNAENGTFTFESVSSTPVNKSTLEAGDKYINALNDNDHYYEAVRVTLASHLESKCYRASSPSTRRGKYVHVVGNGESDTTRSNAHTLDWSGNAWYQGDVFVGGSGQDDTAAKILVAAPLTASVGQTIVVKAVDANGRPTEWEAVNIVTENRVNELIAAALANIRNGEEVSY